MGKRRALPTVKGPPEDAKDASLRVNMEYWIYVGGVVACVVIACLVGYWSMPTQSGPQLGGGVFKSQIYSIGGLTAISLMLVGALSIKSYALLFVWGALVVCHLLMVNALRH
jgi:hypothetical protein